MCRRYLCIQWHWVRPLFPVEWYYFSCYSLMYTWYCSFKAGTKPFTTKEKYLLWHHWLKNGQKSPPMNGLQGQVAVNLYPQVILLIAETFPTAGSQLQLFVFSLLLFFLAHESGYSYGPLTAGAKSVNYCFVSITCRNVCFPSTSCQKVWYSFLPSSKMKKCFAFLTADKEQIVFKRVARWLSG